MIGSRFVSRIVVISADMFIPSAISGQLVHFSSGYVMPLPASQVVIMTTRDAHSSEKAGLMTTLGFVQYIYIYIFHPSYIM